MPTQGCALLRAIIDHLYTDEALSPLLGFPARVHTDPPGARVYPYLTIRSGDDETRADEQVVTLTVVCDSTDLDPANAAARLVRTSLEKAGIPGLRIAFVDCFHAADWRLTLAVLRLRVSAGGRRPIAVVADLAGAEADPQYEHQPHQKPGAKRQEKQANAAGQKAPGHMAAA